MVSQTNEQALESAIEKCLTGTTLEELKAGVQEVAPDFHNRLYQVGFASDFNMQYAIDERFFWQFLQKTQEVELAKLQKNNPSDWQRKLLERFDRLIKKHGILHLLKKGLSVDDAHFNLLYPAPLASSSEKVKQNFADNVFSCTRPSALFHGKSPTRNRHGIVYQRNTLDNAGVEERMDGANSTLSRPKAVSR